MKIAFPVLQKGSGAVTVNPCVLAIDPGASIMGSDIEIRTVVAWARFLRESGAAPSASFACFDACKMPFADGCVDVICSDAGFTNILYQNTALNEAFRVLRSGGLLAIREEQISGHSKDAVPEIMGPQVSEALPGFINGWVEIVGSLGFGIEQHHSGKTRLLDPNESGLAEGAARKGLRIEVQAQYIIARK